MFDKLKLVGHRLSSVTVAFFLRALDHSCYLGIQFSVFT